MISSCVKGGIVLRFFFLIFLELDLVQLKVMSQKKFLCKNTVVFSSPIQLAADFLISTIVTWSSFHMKSKNHVILILLEKRQKKVSHFKRTEPQWIYIFAACSFFMWPQCLFLEADGGTSWEFPVSIPLTMTLRQIFVPRAALKNNVIYPFRLEHPSHSSCSPANSYLPFKTPLKDLSLHEVLADPCSPGVQLSLRAAPAAWAPGGLRASFFFLSPVPRTVPGK